MKALRFAPAARDEFHAAALWYESRSEGLGLAFLGWLSALLERIQEAPAAFPTWPVDSRFRKAVSDGFPYVVFFRELPGALEVVAIAHGARAPGYWLRRP